MSFDIQSDSKKVHGSMGAEATAPTTPVTSKTPGGVGDEKSSIGPSSAAAKSAGVPAPSTPQLEEGTASANVRQTLQQAGQILDQIIHGMWDKHEETLAALKKDQDEDAIKRSGRPDRGQAGFNPNVAHASASGDGSQVQQVEGSRRDNVREVITGASNIIKALAGDLLDPDRQVQQLQQIVTDVRATLRIDQDVAHQTTSNQGV